jgi:hypothetical protein
MAQAQKLATAELMVAAHGHCASVEPAELTEGAAACAWQQKQRPLPWQQQQLQQQKPEIRACC